MLVVIDEPTGKRISGGKVAAPVAADIIEYAVRQLHVPRGLDRRARSTPAGGRRTRTGAYRGRGPGLVR